VGWAQFGDRLATDVVEVRHDVRGLGAGFWGLVVTFEGEVTAVRFATVRDVAEAASVPPWAPLTGRWTTSLDRAAYVAAVSDVRERIAAGTVYQVNICRVLSCPMPESADLDALGRLLAQGNPAPYAARLALPEAGLDIVCASPEAYLLRRGRHVVSRPIKGTAVTAEQMLPKDHAENVMIVDLVRNDLSHVCRPGTVQVDRLCAIEHHPGLVHLVSDVSGDLRDDATWTDILAASFPPGSVSGAPKSTALQAISDLEPVPRGPYCGAIGWVDGDVGEASLAVGIRTFWAERDDVGQRWLRFGAGSGITWASDPEAEWEETELKAARLVGLASGTVGAGTGTIDVDRRDLAHSDRRL
jgi:para-aminobenzoate synthetase component 1